MFVIQLKPQLKNKLHQHLKENGFELSKPAYTEFCAKKTGISCTLYESGKLVIQGKESSSFIEFYIEPELLQSFDYTAAKTQKNHSSIHPPTPSSNHSSSQFQPHIGIDESGKGDFFGPLCVAGVYATPEQIVQLIDIGVRDSKDLSDATIYMIAPKIQKLCLHHIVKINPSKYNEIYYQFNNLNRLLGWGHATTIEYLVEHSDCSQVTIDQFADESVVLTALKRKKLKLELTQRHKAESDPVVAAASILARYAFLEGLKKLGESLEVTLPKGASPAVIKMGKQIFRRYGREGLAKIGKLHFKTLDSILKNE
jgi:ribonuclease HIII